MAFMGIAPFGSLLAGCLASRIGAPDTLAISGAAVILGSIFFAKKSPLILFAVRSHVPSGSSSASDQNDR
jgi:hypothetical protein